mmetsp:Transcript_28584/g.40729  ORF Transcript_28584/g.40729 Transcript_28584/m.40729 type:complete len:386 (+) Transcript_28584:20-1177(+)
MIVIFFLITVVCMLLSNPNQLGLVVAFKPHFVVTHDQIVKSSSGKIQMTSVLNAPITAVKKAVSTLSTALTRNPIARIVSNTYDFFYWFPRRNLPYDRPWALFRNTSAEWIAWYQIPHNLPPYGYLGEGHPADFFCYGLPGNTMPLGNWDPCGFQLVSKSVVRKYRESELKHGRLAMLACVGFVIQEAIHPLHEDIGGMAITHMQQLREVSLSHNMIYRLFFDSLALPDGLLNNQINANIPVDYLALLAVFMSAEIFALKRNWTRWRRNEYNHQFDHNIGIGNLKESYSNGDYGFDPLKLLPEDEENRLFVIESELNNGRLAMMAFIGMLGQEYLTGVPVIASLQDLLTGGGSYSDIPGTDSETFIDQLKHLPDHIMHLFSQNTF